MKKEKQGFVGYHGESLKFDSSGRPLATESEYVEVRDSGIHGKGVFSRKDIPKGARVLEYVGEKITKSESDKRADEHLDNAGKNHEKDGGVYIFELNKRYDIDGKVLWNTARLINHSCNPNCETEDHENYIWIQALRDIKKGEEITYNYGYDLDNFREHRCKCGSKNCVGFIVDEKYWPKLKKKLKAS
jgi:SET domain-containing protein